MHCPFWLCAWHVVVPVTSRDVDVVGQRAPEAGQWKEPIISRPQYIDRGFKALKEGIESGTRRQVLPGGSQARKGDPRIRMQGIDPAEQTP